MTSPSFAPLPDGRYATILADPPWRYGDKLPGNTRGAERHYETLTVSQIADLGKLLDPHVAADAHMYLWTTNAFIDAAYFVLKTWAFEPKTMITWVKTKNGADYPRTHQFPQLSMEEDDVRIGMGHYWRNVTEHCIFATRGRLPAGVRYLPGIIFGPRGEHSAKPPMFYDRIELMSPEPRLELFARNTRPGWTSWGNEVPVG